MMSEHPAKTTESRVSRPFAIWLLGMFAVGWGSYLCYDVIAAIIARDDQLNAVSGLDLIDGVVLLLHAAYVGWCLVTGMRALRRTSALPISSLAAVLASACFMSSIHVIEFLASRLPHADQDFGVELLSMVSIVVSSSVYVIVSRGLMSRTTGQPFRLQIHRGLLVLVCFLLWGSAVQIATVFVEHSEWFEEMSFNETQSLSIVGPLIACYLLYRLLRRWTPAGQSASECHPAQ